MSSSNQNQPDPPASSVCLNPLTNATTAAQQYRSSVFVEADASFASATPNVMYGTGESAVGLNSGAAQHTTTHTTHSHAPVSVGVETAPTGSSSIEGTTMASAVSIPNTVLRSMEEAPSLAQPELKKRKKSPSATKQHQLPMFLTSKFQNSNYQHFFPCCHI